MTVEKRNFWIILTMIAVLLAAVNLIKKSRSHHRADIQILLDDDQDRTCRAWKKKRNHCRSYSEAEDKQRLIERKSKECGVRSHVKHDEFFLPDQLPTLLNYESVSQQFESVKVRRSGTFAARVQVSSEGEYISHVVLRSDQPELTEIVEEHIAELQFEPAVHKGEKVTAWVNVPFRFRAD